MKSCFRGLLVLTAGAFLLLPATSFGQTPIITSISPQPIPAGTPVSSITIYGTNIGSLGDSIQWPGRARRSAPYSSSPGAIQVMVPETWSGNITVETPGGTSAPFPLQVTYCWSGHKWFSGGTTPQWFINQNGAPGVTFTNLEWELRAAFATWECASGFDIDYGGSTALTSPGYADGTSVQYWVNTPWSDPNVIAVSTHYYIIATGQITEADVAFNGHDYTWTIGGAGNTMDIQAVAAHEDGHNIGLGDLYGSYDSQKTMYGIGDTGQTGPRYLHEHDIVGAEYVYPHSGRANLTSTTPSGWWGPVVPHPFPDATDTSAPLPAVLPGNQAAYVSFSETNSGLDCASPEARVAYDLDGVYVGSGGWFRQPFLPGQILKWTNRALTVRGGRHTIRLRHDYLNWIPESNDGDNSYEAQLSWSAYGLADQTPVVRSAPPDPGTGTYNNCEGFMFTSNWWGLVAATPQNASDDYDLTLYDDYVGSQTGYQTPLIYSGALSGKTDFVVANGNILGQGQTYWAGTIGYDSVVGSDVVVCQSNQVGASMAPSEVYGSTESTGPRYLVANQLAKVHEFYVSNIGYAWGITLDNVSGGANLNMAIVDPTMSYAARNYYYAEAAANGAGGDEYYVLYPPQVGWYGVVVYKDGTADNGLAAQYELRVGLALSNLHPDMATLDGPIIPRDDATASSGNAQVSSTLDGNSPTTWLSWAYEQDGPNSISDFQAIVFLDGEPNVADLMNHIGTMPPATIEHFNRGPIAVRGGRHTLQMRVDSGDDVAELDENDNVYSAQWIWSPLATTKEVPVVRAAPPVVGTFALPNCDATSFSRDPNFSWVAAMVGSHQDDDYDLAVVDDYSGSTVGFDNVLATSIETAGEVDFVVGHRSGAQTTLYPAVNDYDTVVGSDFVLDQTDAAGHEAMGIGDWPGMVFAAYRLADVYDCYLTGGQRYLFELQQLDDPSADLRFAIFPADAGGVYGLLQAIENGVPFGPGRKQQVFQPSVDGWYPAVVYRGNQDGVDQSFGYDFRFMPTDMTGVEPDALPTAFTLRSAVPNPASSSTRFTFALPHTGRLKLELFDVRGRRVRSLLDELYPPGVHSISWDMRDERGHRVSAGSYWARLSMGSDAKTLKMTVLR